MKHAIRYILLLLVGTLSLSSCSKETVIPDDELKVIIREMFLSNAYMNVNKMKADSLDIYTPILSRYGYTQDDFFFTLANFQKRKSARLGDVVNEAIIDLENLSDGYQTKVRNMQYIDSLAKAACRKRVFYCEDIEVTRMKDTAKLRLSIPIVGKGEYEVKYVYTIDTLDKNLRLQSEHATYDPKGKRLSLMRSNLSSGSAKKLYTTTITPKPEATEYVLILADYARRDNDPHITFHHVSVEYTPPIEEALERMSYELRIKPMIYYNDSVRIRDYHNTPIPTLPTDTVWVPLDSMELALADSLHTQADSLAKQVEKLQKELGKLKIKSGDTSSKQALKGQELTKEIEELEDTIEQQRQSADSLEILVMGHTRKRD